MTEEARKSNEDPRNAAIPCDLVLLAKAKGEHEVKDAFRDAWKGFFGGTVGKDFASLPSADQRKKADAYMAGLPGNGVDTIPTNRLVVGRAWFACYLRALAGGNTAAADAIQRALG